MSQAHTAARNVLHAPRNCFFLPNQSCARALFGAAPAPYGSFAQMCPTHVLTPEWLFDVRPGAVSGGEVGVFLADEATEKTPLTTKPAANAGIACV